MPEVLSAAQARATLARIVATQEESGCIPWYPGGHSDPWDHVEAAMGLDAAGEHASARRAYLWLRAVQRRDGAWHAGYREGRIVDETFDANYVAYAAAGLWHHFLATGDDRFLAGCWAMVEAAIDWALELQVPEGEILWARDGAGRTWPGALLTSCSCIALSLHCAVRIAERTGNERPDWELSLDALVRALRAGDERFEDKRKFAMDWYYPVLAGAFEGLEADARLASRWEELVVAGRGARCVADRPWVTTGETAELALALARAGRPDDAATMLEWVQHLRDADGSYWTGATFPAGTVWPREKTTWSAAAVLLADAALDPTTPTAAILCAPVETLVSEPAADLP